MYRAYYALLFGSLSILSSVTGCGSSGPDLVNVTGTVTLDGKPIEGAAIMFMPQFEGRPATGVTNADGKFRLTTIESNDGALVGLHKVTVSLTRVTGFLADKDGLSGGVASGGIQEERIVPERYSNAETSELTVDIAPGMKPVQLELSS